MMRHLHSSAKRRLPTLCATFALLGAWTSKGAWAGPEKLDAHAERAASEGRGDFDGGRFAPTHQRHGQAHLDVFIDADLSELPRITSLGAEVRTILPSGLMTASVPIAQLHAVATLSGVRRVEASRRMELRMDVAAGPTGVNVPLPPDDISGAGAIVGVLDTGIDIEHPDFEGRILKIWDHTLDPSDVGGAAPSPSGYGTSPYGTEWSKAQIDGGYATCAHRDENGHGTHVAGTAAGSGAAPIDTAAGDPPQGYKGLAPGADFLIVEFDFDNVKGRNTDAAMVDGVKWIFDQAALLNRPAVINMSLGQDYSPHDGTLGQERGIDQLTGPGRIVVVAAGNAGRSYASSNIDLWGPPLHGAGAVDGNTDDITVVIPSGYSPGAGNNNDYVFFDIWYSGQETNRIQVRSPSGKLYPPNFNGANRNLWKTGGTAGGFNTAEGFVYCANKAAVDNGWDTTNGDNNIYCEISDYQSLTSANPPPAAGTWRIDLIPLTSPAGGAFHAWNGNSASLNRAVFRYEGTLSDNVMTVGAPATAHSVIAVGAYQTKNCWRGRAYSDETDPASAFTIVDQCYGAAPVDYYDPFTLGDIAYFSSRGPSRDARTSPLPFISAPGVGIIASLSQTVLNAPGTSYHRSLNRISPTGFYTTLQGTSMATPNATGSVALLLARAASVGANNDPGAIKGYLQSGARTDAFTGLVPNSDWGHGKIDVSGSIPFIVPPPNQPPIANAGPDQTVTDADGNGSEDVTLNGSLSSDADGTIVSYEWRDGSGGVIGTSPQVMLSLSVGGPYAFTLTVTDDDAAQSSDAVLVTVQPQPQGDSVTITKSVYTSRQQRLEVEATSTGAPTAVLNAAWGPSPSGSAQMTYDAAKGKYVLRRTGISSAPAQVTVTSSLGGSATSPITVR